MSTSVVFQSFGRLFKRQNTATVFYLFTNSLRHGKERIVFFLLLLALPSDLICCYTIDSPPPPPPPPPTPPLWPLDGFYIDTYVFWVTLEKLDNNSFTNVGAACVRSADRQKRKHSRVAGNEACAGRAKSELLFWPMFISDLCLCSLLLLRLVLAGCPVVLVLLSVLTFTCFSLVSITFYF